MPEPGNLATHLWSIEVLPCKWAERGVPRLVPDPRPAMAALLLAPIGAERMPIPKRWVIVAHPDDIAAERVSAGQ